MNIHGILSLRLYNALKMKYSAKIILDGLLSTARRKGKEKPTYIDSQNVTLDIRVKS